MRIRPPEFETRIYDVKYHVSLVGNILMHYQSPRCIMVVGSLATLDLPMVVDLIGIFVLKGPYYTLTVTDWFFQALSVIVRGSWGDVARRFTLIRWTQNGDLPVGAPLGSAGLPEDLAKANTEQSSPKREIKRARYHQTTSHRSPALDDQLTNSTIHATEADHILCQFLRTCQLISNLIPARAHPNTLFPKAGTHRCSHSSNRYAQTAAPIDHTVITGHNQPMSELVAQNNSHCVQIWTTWNLSTPNHERSRSTQRYHSLARGISLHIEAQLLKSARIQN
ncbi:hypothetical protein F511_27996 [Dorcoceras hygrometricum]|uniref:Uncharacterized protein n=1 Tax=Dorcoceras hygrometricum TaxID=472368 RepID=A0A2Z7BVY6_9LAMI|nr:hypothetical protein F511_27996 [Dorcoceras hygrometricum]